MFRGNRPKDARSTREEGPTSVPGDEPVHRRSFLEDDATESLLSLRRHASDTGSSSDNAVVSNDVKKEATTQTTVDEKDEGDNTDKPENDRKRKRSAILSQEATTNHASVASAQAGGGPRDLNFLGVVLEYAAGVGLRSHVLEPVLKYFPDSSEDEATRFLGIYSRGEFLLLSGRDCVYECSIARITAVDGPTMAMWWEGDKFLSYTDQTWSDWWIRRCQLFDPGCEMIKLVNDGGETLGVVYYERNIVDRLKFGKNGRITLIRGIRIAPTLNPEVLRRGDLAWDHSGQDGALYLALSLLLFNHVLFMSLRYGSHAVGVNCPKNEAAERFYQSIMGTPVGFDESGRRYYRINQQTRWKLLQKAYHQQVDLWLKKLTVNGSGKNEKPLENE